MKWARKSFRVRGPVRPERSNACPSLRRGESVRPRKGKSWASCGVEGNGQTELAECIMGMRPQTGGRVLLCGEDVSRKTPGEIRRRGVSFIPEDRMTTGVDGKSSVAENLLVGKHAPARSSACWAGCICAAVR